MDPDRRTFLGWVGSFALSGLVTFPFLRFYFTGRLLPAPSDVEPPIFNSSTMVLNPRTKVIHWPDAAIFRRGVFIASDNRTEVTDPAVTVSAALTGTLETNARLDRGRIQPIVENTALRILKFDQGGLEPASVENAIELLTDAMNATLKGKNGPLNFDRTRLLFLLAKLTSLRSGSANEAFEALTSATTTLHTCCVAKVPPWLRSKPLFESWYMSVTTNPNRDWYIKRLAARAARPW